MRISELGDKITQLLKGENRSQAIKLIVKLGDDEAALESIKLMGTLKERAEIFTNTCNALLLLQEKG